MAQTQKSYLTAVFKLRTPSRRKRTTLLRAMEQCHRAYDKTLRAIQPKADMIAALKSQKERESSLKQLKKDIRAMLKPLPLGNGPKAGVAADVAWQVKSYLALKKEAPNTSYPTTAKLKVEQGEYEHAVTDLSLSTSLMDENHYRALLLRLSRPGIPRPINIMKNRISDGALILRNKQDRLLAFINLHPRNSSRAHDIDLTGLTDTRTGEVLTSKTRCGEVFPLQCGRWHIEKFLEPGRAQSHRLIFDGEEFYLATTFLFEAEMREPENYLGIDRGIEKLAAWSVLDPQANRLAASSYSGERLRSVQRRHESMQRNTQKKGKVYSGHTRRSIANEELHKLANILVEQAIRYNARVVMEDLSSLVNGPHQKRAKGTRKGGWRRLLTRAQYGKLQKLLDYRLQIAGFPPVRTGQPSILEISPAYTSQTCSQCGHKDARNRQSQALFLCTRCGHKENADINASSIIAAKGIHFDTFIRGRRKGQKLKEHEQFPAWYAGIKHGVGAHVDAP